MAWGHPKGERRHARTDHEVFAAQETIDGPHEEWPTNEKGDVLLRREESKGTELPASRMEGDAEGYSFEDLAAGLTEVGVTRAQALKVVGLGGAGFLFTLLWPAEADARRRRRRRRKAQVTPNPVVVVPGTPFTLTITNPSDKNDLTISGVKVLDSDGKVIAVEVLTDPVTIAPGETTVVPITIDGPLVDADKLRLIDERGVPITVVDENGVSVGDIDIDVA